MALSVRLSRWQLWVNAAGVVIAALLQATTAVADTSERDTADISAPKQIRSFFAIESVFPQQAGEFELRTDNAFSRQSQSKGWDAPVGIEIEYGITDRLSISAGAAWLLSRDGAGARHDDSGPVSLGMLYSVSVPAEQPAMSFLLEITTPTASGQGLREDAAATQLEFVAILARTFDAVQVHLNVGGELERGGKPAVSIGAGMLLQAGALTPTLELSASDSSEETTLSIVPGLHWELNASTDLSVGAAASLAGSKPFTILSAVSVEF